LNITLSGIEVELYALQTGRQHHLDGLIDAVETLHRLTDLIGSHYVLDELDVRQDYEDLVSKIDGFETRVGVLATVQDRELALSHNLAALDAASQMHQSLLRIARHVQSHAKAEQAALTGRFRWLVIAMAIGFLIVINGSILLMMRAAGMVLRPVARLVHASRELANQNFAHRVTVGQHDEFDECYSLEQIKPELLKGHLLLVTPSELDHRIIKHYLRETCLSVTIAVTGDEALAAARERCDVVLIELNDDEFNGEDRKSVV